MTPVSMRLAATLILLVLLAVPSALPGQVDPAGCRAAPAVQEVLDQLGEYTEMVGLPVEEWNEKLALVEGALEEHPDDLFLHRRRQDLFRAASKDRSKELHERMRREYSDLRDSHPGDPRFHYLVARIAGDPELERQAAETAIRADPGFAWGHIAMVTSVLREAEEPLDSAQEARAEEHLARFIELCPNQVFGALVYSFQVGDSELWGPRLPEMRKALREAPGSQPRAFSLLWSLEFRLAEVVEHGAVRERVAGDVASLAALGSDSAPVLSVMKEGYSLAGMEAESAALAERIQERSPCAREAVFATLEEWYEQQKTSSDAPSGEPSAAQRRAFEEATRRWVARCPDEYVFWIARLRALDQLESADPAEILAAGERAAELYGRFRGFSSPSAFEQVARIFIGRGLALDRAAELLDQAEAEATKRTEGRDLADLPEGTRRKIERGEAYALVGRTILRARSAAGLGEVEPARSLLREAATRLDELDPGTEGTGLERLGHQGYQSALWQARAELAEAEGRIPDAVAHLLRAESARPEDAPGQGVGPAEGVARERALELWAGLGGTEEGFAALEGGAGLATAGEPGLADYSPWEASEGPLPPFELPDPSGRIWKLEDLEGKTVFANAWATWCGPCRSELPVVQALHERFQDRDDVLVVTLNMDDNTGLVAPFMAKEGFTFPVLLASEYLRQELEVFSIPQSWIVDPTLERRFEQSGYTEDVDEADWIADVEERIRTAVGAAGRADSTD